MVTSLDTAGLRRLLEGDVQLVEVLPRDEFEEEHLAGAVVVPLEELTSDGVASLDRTRPTVVYGFDHQCDRSPRAAARLEAMGFADVYDYANGKAAWLADGLPSEGRRRPEQRVAAVADRDFPRVAAAGTIGDTAAVFANETVDVAVVLDPDGIVLGVVRREVLGLDPATPLADVLQPGPSTFRPSLTIEELVQYFRTSDERRAIVTTLGGRWMGMIRREDVVDD
ncbi:MAG TPA: rhodanese-like domain-containing protein [Acidimicrobiales bacterium]|nr:rhodanese-like domain-containing protein [Acidimicrobiales bacterium]